MAQLSARYAAALFDIAKESDRLDAFYEQALLVKEALQFEGYPKFIENPNISKAEKRAFMEQAFAGHVSDGLSDFLHFLIEKNREKFIASALSDFIALADRHKGRITAHVVSAAHLDEGQMDAIRQLLCKKLNKQVEVEQRVDTSLIGGFYVHADGYLYDRSVRSALQTLKGSIKIAL
jgi:F-type H+-transporting ATPase subunit delta